MSWWDRAKRIVRSEVNHIIDKIGKVKDAADEKLDDIDLDEFEKKIGLNLGIKGKLKKSMMPDNVIRAFKVLELDPDELFHLDSKDQLPWVNQCKIKLLMKHHPDRFPNHKENQKKAEKKSMAINEAYTIIKEYLQKRKKGL